MPFIGNQPALSYTSFAKQDFTTSATTSYTLDHPVTNENEIALFINFVRQEPTTAYSASNTTLTLTSATSATDDMYCVFLGKAVQTVNPPSGSVGLSQLSATGTKDATTFLRGDNTFAVAGGDNTPAFAAYLNTSQSLSTGANTKINMTTEDWDTDGAYDAANSKFTIPSGAAGKYRFLMGVRAGNTHTARMIVKLYKNGGTQFIQAENRWSIGSGTTFISVNLAADIDCSVGDYFEPYVYMENNAGLHGVSSERHTFWSASKLIGV